MEIEILRLQAKQLLSEYMNLDKISANIGLLLCVQTLFQVEFNFFFRLGSIQHGHQCTKPNRSSETKSGSFHSKPHQIICVTKENEGP